MTPSDTLLALAGRCEAATGRDRELDYAIHESIHGEWLRRNAYTREPGDDGWASPTPPVKGTNFIAAPQSYTASLDAAMTLASGFVLLHLSDIGADGLPLCKLGDPTTTPTGEWTGIAARLELAICAASLRARAALASGVAK